jgi:hypothetical protein
VVAADPRHRRLSAHEAGAAAAHYSELLARVGRLAVDTRDPQALLDRVPIAAVEALRVDVAMVYLLEPNMLELRVAGEAGRMPGERSAAGRQPPGHLRSASFSPRAGRSSSGTIGRNRASACPRRIWTRA